VPNVKDVVHTHTRIT